MELSTPIVTGQPLIVAALPGEVQFLPARMPILFTGVGKVRAATALATTLALSSQVPGEIVNLGTAGSLVSGLRGIFEIGEVIQHDFDNEQVHTTTGVSFAPPIRVSDTKTVLATGDTFISDSAVRTALAQRGAHLCDMEGYALAFVAAKFQVPIRLIKVVSDSADENAGRTWPETLESCAKSLAEWVSQNL